MIPIPLSVALIQCSLDELSRPIQRDEVDFVRRYLGTNRRFVNVKSKDRDAVLRKLAPSFRALTPEQSLEILDGLVRSDTFDYLNFAGKALTLLPSVREKLSFPQLQEWLLLTSGWAECDSLCQSLFPVPEEVLARYEEWVEAIAVYRNSPSVQVRRASLVLQVKPVGRSDDPRLRYLAFQTVELLKHEKSVLITKAISWVLRALVVQDAQEVARYIERERPTLPAIAYRETLRKIETGRK